MNPEAEVLLGCSAEAVRSKLLSSLLQTPAMGCRFASVEDMLAALQPNDGKRVTGAFLVERAEGGRRVIEVTCRRFTSESAEDAMIAVLRDVSELSERVAEAQRNEARFRTLSHALSDYAYVLRVDGRRRVQLEWATPTLLDVFDIQAAELETRIAWGKRIPHYERAKVLAHLRNLLANKTDSAEFRIVGKDQEVRWIANRARPHYDEQVRRVTYIYGAAHDITERKRLEEQRRRDQRIQSLLHKILRYSLEAPSLQEGLTQVLNLILSAPFLKLFHRGGIFLTDETQRRLVLTAQVNLPPALQSICAFVPFGRCLCGRAAETGQIQTASCVDERHENVYPGLAPHGHFNVPLVSEGKVLGVMMLYVEHGHRFEAPEFSFLRAAADIVAGIIKRGQANELLRRQFNELLAVHSMTSTLNSARSLDEINAAALRTLVDGLRADRASILLFDHNGVMRFVAWSGLSDAYRAAVEGHSPWSADAQSAEPILIEDVAVDPSVAAIRSHVLGEGIRSLAFIPLLHGGRLLGKLTLYFNTPHSFSDEEVRVAKAVATHIAAAVARHHAEERRRAIERIVDNSQVVLFRWRPEPGWPVAFVSEQVRQFGYTPDDFVSGRIDYASIVHPDDLVRVRDEVRSYISTNTDRFRQEYRILTRDGKVRWVDDRSLVVRDNAGKINYVEGTILDITEQKQAQQALEASEEELRTLFAAMDDLVLVIDQEGVYRKIAPTHPDLLYRPAAELVGRRLHDVFPRKQADLFLGAIHQCLQSQQRTLLEYELAIGERKVPFLASVSPFSHDATLWIIRDISGLKKAQAEVEMLALAVKSLDECVSITDVDDRFIFVNESFERTYGYRREELLGKHLGVIRSPLNAPEHVAQILPATLAGGWRGELMNRRKDGTDFPISLTTAAVRDAEGNVVALIGVAQDITERKRAEQALKESEERFRLLAESSLTGIYLIHDQKFAYINQSFAATFGYTVEEIVNNLGPLDLTHPDDRPRVVENIRRRVAGGVEAIRYDFRGVKKDGAIIYVEVHGRRIEYAGKIGIIGTLVDITERKRAEETLRESELRFRSVWENATDGMRITNEEGSIVMVNEAFCRMVEKSREELEGQPLSVVYEPTRHHDVLRKHQERFRSRTIPPYLERELTLWNGKKMSFALSNTFLELPGRPPLSLSIFRDITERKRAESLRLRLGQVLESIAGDEALPQILERLVRAIEEFVPEMKGSVLLIDADGKRLRHGSAPSLPDDYNRAVDGLVIGPRVGSCGTAAYEKRLVIVEDIQTDPLWADYRDLAAKHGLRACWSQPIIDRDGAVLGTFALYYDKPRKPTEAELELINTAANVAGIAIKRKWAEEALRQSELRYRTVVANAPVILWALDRDGQFTFSEGKGLERLGLKPGEVVGRSVFEVYKDFPEIVHNNCQALEGKTVTTVVEVAGLSFETHYAPLFGNGGEIIGAIGLAIDITERKRAEKALRESEERYRFLYNGTPSMFFTVDEHGTIVSVNNFGATYLGYTVDELVGTSVLTLFHGDDRAAVAEALQQCLKHPGATHTWRYRKRHKDGSVLWVEETASAVQMPGRSVQVLVVCTDISERVRMEAALRQSEERYRTFFEDDLTGDYISTPEGKLLECNPAFVKMFGFASREQALATSATVLYSDPKKREEFIQRVRAQKRLEYVETELRRVDGSPLYAIENVTGIFDERGELVMLRGYLFDDTRRRLLEQHLIQAQKLDSLGTLASGVAHDFNNILSIVVGHGSLLKRHAHHDQTVARHADAILSATERGVGLVRQILTFARRTESAFEELNVHALIHEHVKLLSETFPKTIEIALDLTSQSVLIQGDATQIHQVLLNLSVNARDAMPQGGKLTISTRVVPGSDLTKRFPEARAQSYIQLCVSDTGIGMDEQTQQKVFEPFFTTKDRSKGTGLGLAVVYGVVQSHKGFIDLQSVPGEGTTFSLYFPLLMKTFATADRAQQVAVEDLRGSETLLLVEDEEMLLALMNDLLTAQGYHVLAAPDSETALRLYRKQHSRIDAVISDFGLPKFNGLELYRRLRSINPNVRMMIASGFIEPETKDLMLEEGILHVVAKPYRPDEVLRLLRKMFVQ
jgi:PAS domain S-box-containing protein